MISNQLSFIDKFILKQKLGQIKMLYVFRKKLAIFMAMTITLSDFFFFAFTSRSFRSLMILSHQLKIAQLGSFRAIGEHIQSFQLLCNAT